MELEFCEIEIVMAVYSVIKTSKGLGGLKRLGRELLWSFDIRAVE